MTFDNRNFLQNRSNILTSLRRTFDAISEARQIELPTFDASLRLRQTGIGAGFFHSTEIKHEWKKRRPLRLGYDEFILNAIIFVINNIW